MIKHNKEPKNMTKDNQDIINQTPEELSNSLSSLLSNLTMGTEMSGAGTQLSQLGTIFKNLRYNLLSNHRQTLSEMYVEHGIVQTLVDQPVDDAFSSGFDIITDQLSQEEKEEVLVYLEKNKVTAVIKQAMKWARLYGGGAVIILTKQDPSKPLNLDRIYDFSDVRFKSADMWELYNDAQNLQNGENPLEDDKTEFYNYYGIKVHKSRVLIVSGKEAPAFIRPRLRGWGMSELERLVRSLNQYLKNQDVVFELLDEAKVDVYGVQGMNSALLSATGTNKIAQRIQMANQLKNYQNAITMDAEDTYEQKQMSFSGLDGMLVQIRQGVAADLKMPVTKLFGVSSAGFNSGEDDIENYNSMIESEIRAKSKYIVIEAISIVCKKLFDFIPDDLMIEFSPLRILSAEQQENVKDKQFERIMRSYDRGLISAKEAKEAINAKNLLPIEATEDDVVFLSIQSKEIET